MAIAIVVAITTTTTTTTSNKVLPMSFAEELIEHINIVCIAILCHCTRLTPQQKDERTKEVQQVVEESTMQQHYIFDNSDNTSRQSLFSSTTIITKSIGFVRLQYDVL